MSALRDRNAAGTMVASQGEGPSLILVHGLGVTIEMWDWLAPFLSSDLHVIRYDLLGHGDSPDPDQPCTMDQLTDQLLDVADHFGLTEFHLAGFSLGGLIVQAFALKHPERVRSLTILNAAHDRTPQQRDAIRKRVAQARADGPAATVDAALERWFTPEYAKQYPLMVEQVRVWVTANDPEVYPTLYHVLAEADAPLAMAISEIRCPTLVMTAEEDYGNSPEMTRRTASLIPGAKAVVLPGLRHMGLVEDAGAFAAHMIPFLKQATSQ